MTHEEIEAAIGRLEKLEEEKSYVAYDVMRALIGRDFLDLYYNIGALKAFLQQADPDTHIKLPTDSEGEPIHIGDEVCGYDHPNGGVYCHAIVNPCVIAVGEMFDYSNSKGWALWNTLDVRRYHKPTVSEILDELEGLRGTGDYESVVMRAAELAGMLREMIADD